MRKLLGLVFLIGSSYCMAKDPYPKNEAIDITHYRFYLELNDSTDVIAGQAWITILFKKAIAEFELDFVKKNKKGQGMEVTEMLLEGSPVNYTHQNDRIKITLRSPSSPGSYLRIMIRYTGIPQAGLIIGKNKFGDRTFFGDNWPDRAHHWLPSIDHPSDKATCEFIVVAPEHYQVVGNGKKVEESSLPKNRKLTHWEETVDIPTKVMVIGAARFAIRESGRVEDIDVQSWVYPQNRDEGFSDYSKAVRILDFFYHHIGPYPYEKLANVQSTTLYGGMENASAIFYPENSVTGKNEYEETIAHEIAHQWFGDSATEDDWHHIWLSEGFATYLSHLYMEFSYGHDVLIEEMAEDRDLIIRYSKTNSNPVIDTSVTQLGLLLNTNCYQKGGWVLHMLRREVGELNFWKGLQNYYQSYRDSNALTADFQRIMEEVSKKDLSRFFNQWLWKGGHPRLSGLWKYGAKSKSVQISIDQEQPGTHFDVPLDIAIRYADGHMQIHTVRLDGKSLKFNFPVENMPQELMLDPKTWLLFEGQLSAQ